jgi:DNA-binding NarL/FixJ family response regulator
MPDKSGLDVLKEIRIERPKIPVLILSVYPEDRYATRVLKAGANGYMTKESAPDELVDAIRTVARGKKYVSPSLAEKLAFELDARDEKPPHETLSDRGIQILCLIASGKTLSNVMMNCIRASKPVTRISRVLEKMNLKNNSELIAYAISLPHRLKIHVSAG